jgi:outer membrane usher protein
LRGVQRLIRWLAVLLVVLLHGAAAMAQELERAVLELVVNGSNSGEVFVLLRDGDVLVPLKSLRDAGLVRLDVTTEEHEGVEHVSLRTASPPLAFEFDDRALTVSVFAPPSVLALATVDLANRPPADVRYESSPSAYFNYAPRLVDGTGFQAFGEVGASLGPALAETSATYSDYGGATRLASRVTFDDRKHLRSAIIGDSFVSAGPLGGALVIGGLSFVRNYELDPYLVKIPRLGYTGRAMSPSTVDVYVNDVLVRRVPVEPGEFELTNVTPVSGAGTTRYVIRDAYGREQRLESTYYASSSVLAEGFSEYS